MVHHARARTCAVRIAVVGEHLVVDVTDDGIGLPDRGLTPGVGLASMGERAAEMGGECRTEAAPHGGTRVLARPPLSGD